VVLADKNSGGAKALVDALTASYGAHRALAVETDVTQEKDVQNLMEETALCFGGLDIFINNAGIVRSGGVDSLSLSDFELVACVNYTAYFLCVKYAAAVMRAQRAFAPGRTSDIIEINSKSGLSGSKRNFAYAGSKFGGIGLTKSFALELCEYGIKVNAVCPGNFLDGPLWADPEKGLFRQYLEAGKVPGAKTLADVRRHYEALVPMGRGCTVLDVARAVFYIVEQQYETGQAVPVTGGQEMLS
jgi:NAD(P)-dependent dehydrogenase (short-subunit alcohol dehydrogenase family)